MPIVGKAISMTGPAITEIVLYNYAIIEAGGYLTPAHLHPYHQMDVVLGGCVEHRIEGWEPRELKAGDGLLIPPLTAHGMWSDKGFKHTSFKIYLASHIARQLGDAPFLFKATPALCDLLTDAGERYVNNTKLACDRVVAVGALAVFAALDEAPSADVTDEPDQTFRRRILPVLQNVTEKPYDPWTVVELAHLCHMSVDHFSKRFCSALQQTPQQFLLATRMRAAANELLGDPMLGIKVVAHRAGYSTVHTFSRAFKRYFNVSPGRFRSLTDATTRL